MIKILLILFMFSSNTAFTEEVKLLCDITLDESVGDKTVSNNYKGLVIKITDINSLKMIESSFVKIRNVKYSPDIKEYYSPLDRFIDFSDSTKYDILNEYKYRDGSTIENIRIIIHRDTGALTYHRYFNFADIKIFNGIGICRKISDQEKNF